MYGGCCRSWKTVGRGLMARFPERIVNLQTAARLYGMVVYTFYTDLASLRVYTESAIYSVERKSWSWSG